MPRALVLGGVTTTLCLGSLTGMASASAQVHVDAEAPVRGSTTIITFHVPNESETGSTTTVFTVALPDVTVAKTDVMAGWTAQLDKDPSAGTVRSVTWTAEPGAGIPPNQFEMFQMTVKLPDTETVSFPATQTYADGTVVRWDQEGQPSADEPTRPAPILQLAAPGSATPEHHSPAPIAPAPVQPTLGADNVARALAGGALLVAALGVGIALVRRGA